MSKVAPSQRIREEITRLLEEGLDGKADVTSTLLRLGAQRLAQELLEEDVTDFLGRERYVRHRGDELHRGYRNGYEPGRMATCTFPTRPKNLRPSILARRRRNVGSPNPRVAADSCACLYAAWNREADAVAFPALLAVTCRAQPRPG